MRPELRPQQQQVRKERSVAEARALPVEPLLEEAAALGAIDPPAWSGPRRLRQGNGRGKEDPVVEAALLLRKRLASAALSGEGAAEIERLLGAIRALEQARG